MHSILYFKINCDFLSKYFYYNFSEYMIKNISMKYDHGSFRFLIDKILNKILWIEAWFSLKKVIFKIKFATELSN